MAKFTIFIYKYFSAHKAIFYSILLLSTAFFAYSGLKINFAEDITQLFPSIEEKGIEKFVFANLKVKDKVFILFNSKSEDAGADALIQACDDFAELLIEKDTVYHLISSIFYQVEEETIQNGITFVYDNAPVFLDESLYPQLDSLLDKEQIERQMIENYNTITSTAGIAYKDLITQDPIGLRKLFMSQIGNFGLGGNYALYNGHIFTPDTAVIVAFLAPNFKTLDSKLSTQFVEMLQQAVKEYAERNPDIEILYHGQPVRSVSNADRIKKDLLLTVSISLTLIISLLLCCFKSKSTLFYLLAPIVYGVLFAMSVMYFIKGNMSIMALGIGAIIMGVAFSYCLHVIAHYKYVGSPEKVLEDQSTPVILGVLTTIGAFMSLLFTESELLHDFGLFASLGLVGTTIFALLYMPQFFKSEISKKSDKAFAFLEKINSYPIEKQMWLIVLIVTVSAICFVVSDNVQFDSNLRHIGYNNRQLVRSQNLLASKTAENQWIFYFATISENQDSALIFNYELCQKLEVLRKKKEIAGYSASSNIFIPTGEQKSRINHWNSYWTEEKKEEVRDNIISAGARHKFSPETFEPFFEMLDSEYKPASLYNAKIIPDAILSNLIEFTDNNYLVFTPVRMNKEKLLDIGAKVSAGSGNMAVIDPMYYANNMVKAIHTDFNTTLTVSSLFVLLVLLISLKSFVLAILAFLPMALSWYIVLGVMAIFGLEFNLINIIISSFIFGIGVDYSIFIMDGLLAKYRNKQQSLLAYHKTAIFFSAIILIIVILSLFFAVHPAIHSIGIATFIGMVSTVLIAYSLQPFLFWLLITRRVEKGKTPFLEKWARNKQI
ncbi:MAG: MMPL family transporter [Prevotellaceae bacterium]|jgi:predicted RND superfamily exporter protein|nr:MMPL family transporter [Prevotellaceae bacterium]